MAQETENVLNIVRGAADIFNAPSGVEVTQQCNNRGDQLIAQGLPPLTELVRMGVVWSMRLATASAVNAIVALPTTTALIQLYNGEPAGGKSYVMLNAWGGFIVSAAAATQISLIAQVTPSPLGASTAPTHSATTTLLTSRSGKSNYTGNAKRAISQTNFFTDGWDVIGYSSSSSTANIGLGAYADLNGGIIIPPGGSFGLNVLAGTTNTAGVLCGCTWAEVQLILG
jgi:hypothetical protein